MKVQDSSGFFSGNHGVFPRVLYVSPRESSASFAMGNLHHPSHVLEVSVRVMEEDVLLVMVRLVTVASVLWPLDYYRIYHLVI